MSLILRNISMAAGGFTLRVDVEIRGRITAILGPSGAGKTSLLDLVAGLRPAESMFVQLGDRVLADSSTGVSVPTRHRGIGYVPQDLALFPHLSVRQNVCYGLPAAGGQHGQFSLERVVSVLEIGALLDRAVTGLSGGERQRVALARALLASPRLLLLDEPLASLDSPLKARILPHLAAIRDEFRVPMLYVTHDRSEAKAIADELVVLMAGRVVQQGGLAEVFGRPVDAAVASLLGVEHGGNSGVGLPCPHA